MCIRDRPQIAQAVTWAAESFEKGGRLFYMGAGDVYKRQELLGELLATVIVKIGRVDIKDKHTVVGGIRLQATRGNGSSGFPLGK